MPKKSRVTLMIILPVICVLAVFVAILSIFVKETEEVIHYPSGNLSDSIFDSQNTQYMESSLLTEVHEFEKLPYTIDTVDAECAKIGSGSVYVIEDYYFYYSEIEKTDTMRAAVVREFSQVLNYGIDVNECSADRICTEEGFLNGFRVLYEILEISVPAKDNLSEEQTAYVLSYRLEITDEDSIVDKQDIVIGVVTKVLSNETLEKCKQLLDMSIYTLQYSTELAKDIETGIKNGTIEGELKSENKENESDLSVDLEEGEENESAESVVGGVLTNEIQDKGEKTMGILIKRDYTDLILVIDWSNSAVTPEFEFCDVRAEEIHTPSTVEDGRAVFNIGTIEAGVYMVTIKGWEEAGTFTSNLVGE